MIYLGEKGQWQTAEDFTSEGDPVTLPLDTTVRTYVMSPEDSFDGGSLELTLAGVMEDIEIGPDGGPPPAVSWLLCDR